ncbi:phage tail protein [Obesumbacterium proteus]|uniref:Phage tail fiber protein n=1 Tax=Obesumbacterium proteus ATCC 12841 TaxID=1354268 RepID=A0AA91EDC5_9GAMM|nr:phage tail protein [Obesumbacterium proteus]AMO80098.1 hypothetical protein DSM2777_02965 [Obesumbacterium proteus]OAT58591.1 phage tail fiber protein [Obesumbacterium proteus ATCC 12841]
MAQKYKAVLTKIGAAKIAAATAGGTKINLTQMAVGDGGGTLPTPDPTQTKLIAEKHRAALNKVIVDPKHKNYLVAELVIPPEIGGFWMRELGLFDEVGDLIAVSNMAESYKPLLSEGSGRTQTLRMVVIVSDMDTVNLLIDSSTVLATQEYVDEKLQEHEQSRRHPDATLKEKGFTQLSSATNSTSEAMAATPKAVKAAYDLANGKYTAQDATTAQKGIVQLSSAINSTSETLAATPKAVKTAYDLANGKYTAQDASTVQKGIVQLNSAVNNSSETLAATPKAVKIAYDKALEADEHAKDANTNAGKANDNANTRLEKNKNLSDIPDKAKARASLDLVKQTSPSDTTSGAVLLVEAGGLLSQAPAALSNGDILARNLAAQFFRQGGGTNGDHFGGYGAGIHLPYDTSGITPVSANLFVTSDGRLHVEFATGQTFILGDVYSTVHKPTASDVEALSVNGGALNGALAINSAGRALAIIGDDDKALYFQARDKSGAARWFVGNAGDGDSTVSFHNYKNGTKLDLSNEASVNKPLNVNGKITPSDYANFDAKYSKIATISKSANGYEKDNNTGRIRQWGRTTAFGAGNGYPLRFPIAFPNACTGVTVTLIRGGATTVGSNEASYVGEPGLSGVRLYHGGTEVYPAFWEAVGY